MSLGFKRLTATCQLNKPSIHFVFVFT